MSAADKARADALEKLAGEILDWLDKQNDYPSFVAGFRARLRSLTAQAGDQVAETADTLAPPPSDGPTTLPPESRELGTIGEAALLRAIARTPARRPPVGATQDERDRYHESTLDLDELDRLHEALGEGDDGGAFASAVTLAWPSLLDAARLGIADKEEPLCRMQSCLMAGRSRSTARSRACATSTWASAPGCASPATCGAPSVGPWPTGR